MFDAKVVVTNVLKAILLFHTAISNKNSIVIETAKLGVQILFYNGLNVNGESHNNGLRELVCLQYVPL